MSIASANVLYMLCMYVCECVYEKGKDKNNQRKRATAYDP